MVHGSMATRLAKTCMFVFFPFPSSISRLIQSPLVGGQRQDVSLGAQRRDLFCRRKQEGSFLLYYILFCQMKYSTGVRVYVQ